MRIKSQNAVLNPEKVVKGERLFEFTLNLKEIRLHKGDNLLEKLLNASKKMSNEFLSKVYLSIAEHLKEIKSDESALKHLSCIETSDSCTYVWYACGSCTESLALVEAYCPEGDYAWCEQC
jgi:hypothetical protein